MRWWHFGLIGALTLSLATLLKAVKAFLGGRLNSTDLREAAGFAAAIFGMGFVCGLVVWAGRGLYKRIGWLGDAVTGLAVGVVFFASCMLLFDPDLLGSKLQWNGVTMLCAGAGIGLICGPWWGRDFRKEARQIERERD